MKLQENIVSKLKKHAFGGEETYRFLMSLATNIFVLCVHITLLLIFALGKKGITATSDGMDIAALFIYYNAFAIVLFLLSFALIFGRKCRAYGLLLSVEVCLYTAAFCGAFGLSTYGIVYVVLLLILQVMMPAVSKLYNIISLALFGLTLAFCLLFFGFYFSPLLKLSLAVEATMTVINILIFILGAIIQFWLSRLAAKIAVEIGKNRITALSYEAQTDELTGAFNRRYAKRFFQEVEGSDISYCLAMLDIDDFKIINDTFGHNCGDEVIRFLADCITRNLRSSDILVRWGGEEFLIILNDIDLEMAFEVMDDLREMLSGQVIKTKDNEVSITVTIGISRLSNDPINSINNCDQKMYEGKKRGKNTVVI